MATYHFFLLGLAPSFIMACSARAWVYTCGVTLKEKKETAHSLYIQTLSDKGLGDMS